MRQKGQGDPHLETRCVNFDAAYTVSLAKLTQDRGNLLGCLFTNSILDPLKNPIHLNTEHFDGAEGHVSGTASQ